MLKYTLAFCFVFAAFGWGSIVRDFYLSMVRKLRKEKAPNELLGDHIIATVERLKFNQMVAGNAVQVSNEATWSIGGKPYRILIVPAISRGDHLPSAGDAGDGDD